MSLAISVVAIRLLTTHLGTQFGTYTVVSSIAYVAVGSADAGLGSFALREGANVPRTARPDLLANLLGLRIVLCVVGIVVGRPVHHVTGRTPSFIFGVAVGGAGLAIAMLQQTVTVHLQLDLRNGAVAALELVKTVALAATYAVFVLLGAGLTVFYVAPAIAGFAMLACNGAGRPAGAVPPALPPWILGSRPPCSAAVRPRRGSHDPLLPRDADHDGLHRDCAADERIRPRLPRRGGAQRLSGARRHLGVAADHACAPSGPDRLRPLARSLAQTALLAGLLLATATAAGAPIAIRVIGGGADSPSVAVLQVLAIALAFTFPLALWSYLLLALEQVRALSIGGAVAAVTPSRSRSR